MPSEPVRRRKQLRRYSVVFIPGNESSGPRTFNFGLFSAVAVTIGAFIVITSLVVAVVVYTPLGTLLNVPNPELAERYGREIAGIQQQTEALLREMAVLREFDLRIRRALGEKAAAGDSSAAGPAKEARDVNLQAQTAPRTERETGELLAEGGDSGPLSREARQAVLSPANEFPLTMPADGFITRGFDLEQYHLGIDIAGKQGSPVASAAGGTIVFAGWTYDDGFTMIVAHGRGYLTVYKHNQALLKHAGTAVKRGEIIALLGNTGSTSSGPHLHFEVWKDGIASNPTQYLLTTQ